MFIRPHCFSLGVQFFVSVGWRCICHIESFRIGFVAAQDQFECITGANIKKYVAYCKIKRIKSLINFGFFDLLKFNILDIE